MIDVDFSINVSDVNNYIKKTLENDENLRYLYLKGEISNYKVASNGAAYFTLSDSKSSISCVIFSKQRLAIKDAFGNGDKVRILASINVYSLKGQYSLVAYSIQNQGLGESLIELERLKKKLASEGYFDESKKKPINIYPKSIGIITALNSAAIEDLTFNIHRRYPMVDIYVFPSQVQGETAPKELIKAFKKAQTYHLDSLIIGRGGGASEDLSAFNNEELVRLVATRNCPVISAVGHEIDTTLIDLVADRRASTPTGAAELATADIQEIQERIAQYDFSLKDILINKIDRIQDDLNWYSIQLKRSMKKYIENVQDSLLEKRKRLEDLNPKNILKRGYSIIVNDQGKVINTISNIKVGNTISAHLSDGKITSVVKAVEEDEDRNN